MLILTILAAVLASHVLAHPADRHDVSVHTRAVTNSSKAGLGWDNPTNVDLSQYLTTGKVSWYYTWSPDAGSVSNTSLEFVPMLWGPAYVPNFGASVNATAAQRPVTAVLGLNEPDNPDQSNTNAQDGASMWLNTMQPLRAQGLRLGSPATTSAPAGKTWLQDFFTACNGSCTVDFVAVHWYGVNATEFIGYVEDFHETFQLPIWVTEWACENFVDTKAQCSQSDVNTFLNQTQEFMDQTDWVERYAWFGAGETLGGVNQDDALMSKKGKINSLGKQYIGASSTSDGVVSGVHPLASAIFAVVVMLLMMLV